MKRRDYLKDLEARLGRISTDERVDALAYYDEIFEDRGIQDEDEVPEDMPSSRQAAFEIMRDAQLQELRLEEETDRQKQAAEKTKRTNILGVVILAVLALPIGLPLAIALLALLFAIIMVILAVLFAVVVAAFAVVVGSGAGLVTMATAGVFNWPAALFYVGVILLAIAAFLALISLVQISVRGIRRQLIRSAERRKQKHHATNPDTHVTAQHLSQPVEGEER